MLEGHQFSPVTLFQHIQPQCQPSVEGVMCCKWDDTCHCRTLESTCSLRTETLCLIPSRAPLFKYCPVRPERQRLPRIGGTSGLESASACCPGIITSRANCEAMGVISKQNKTHVSFSEQQNHPFILREHTPSFVFLFSNVFFYSPKFIKSLQDVSAD